MSVYPVIMSSIKDSREYADNREDWLLGRLNHSTQFLILYFKSCKMKRSDKMMSSVSSVDHSPLGSLYK